MIDQAGKEEGVTQAAVRTASVLLIDASPIRSKHIVQAISRDGRMALLALCKSFEDAYNLTEAEQPAVVVISADLLSHPGFPMYQALLKGLQITATVLCPPHLNSARFAHVGRVLDLQRYPEAELLVDEIFGSPNMAGFPSASDKARDHGPARGTNGLVVIGASTGGVEALGTVLSHFPVDCPPTLVVQHIGHDFVHGFARRLDRMCPPRVIEAVDGASIQDGQVHIAPGKPAHLTLSPHGRKVRLDPGPPVSGHRPSVDALFLSAVRFGPSVVAALLTGMGRDGAEGMLKIRQAGGHTIGQNKGSCVVYGMPRVAHEIGGVVDQLPIERIGPALLKAAEHLEKGRAS